MRVILLSDDGDLGTVVAELLDLDGIEVRRVRDVASAVRAVESIDVDALVVDGTLRAAREREVLAALDGAARAPGIVWLSTTVPRGVDAKSATLLLKPFDVTALYAAVRAAARLTAERRATPA